MGVEAAFAVGAEKMGDAHGLLSQYELELLGPALRADLADAAESQYVKGLLFIVEVVDDHAWIQFAEDQVVVGGMLSAARWRGVVRRGWRHRFRKIHRKSSLKKRKREIHHSEIRERIKLCDKKKCPPTEDGHNPR
jgi:hypothetical protein